MLQPGLLKPSFMADRAQRELRALSRKSLIEERAREANPVQLGLEGTTLQRGSVLADVLGASGTRILRAWARGEADRAQLAALADARIRAPPAELARAGEGLLGTHQQFLLTPSNCCST